MPAQDLKKLLERIHTRLDESFVGIGHVVADLNAADLAELINQLTLAEAASVVSMLPVARAIEICNQPTMRRRAAILERLEPPRAAEILTGLAADERTDVVQKMGLHERHRVVPKLSEELRHELEGLLQYPVHTAGGIMTTEFVQLDPTMTVGAALKRIREVATEKESIYACYVMEPGTKHLLGAVSLRDLVMADLDAPLTGVMRARPITVNALDDQEVVAQKIAKYNLLAVPVLESDGSVVGFVTVDDVIDVLVEEGTEDFLRMAAVEPGALDKPYMQVSLPLMIRKRAGWLVILFLGEMLTATAMGFFEKEIAKAVVLALFVPLIISSGGNSGSQASTLVIRALALSEVKLSDWWRVMRREVLSGLGLGLILGLIGFLRITIWSLFSNLYGPHWTLVAMTVGVALIGIVMWGTLAGSMLPFLLRKLGFDPATSSAPFVATLVDVTGLVIYFSVAVVLLRGTLL
ncbi:MAG TPA: magnesium transporter [Pyrinomonadaceae bacterium]|jgi:Mg2+ transporter (mgtE)|nr:magnesium transporter [Pyrinomonadaceae bacterium]